MWPGSGDYRPSYRLNGGWQLTSPILLLPRFTSRPCAHFYLVYLCDVHLGQEYFEELLNTLLRVLWPRKVTPSLVVCCWYLYPLRSSFSVPFSSGLPSYLLVFCMAPHSMHLSLDIGGDDDPRRVDCVTAFLRRIKMQSGASAKMLDGRSFFWDSSSSCCCRQEAKICLLKYCLWQGFCCRCVVGNQRNDDDDLRRPPACKYIKLWKFADIKGGKRGLSNDRLAVWRWIQCCGWCIISCPCNYASWDIFIQKKDGVILLLCCFRLLVFYRYPYSSICPPHPFLSLLRPARTRSCAPSPSLFLRISLLSSGSSSFPAGYPKSPFFALFFFFPSAFESTFCHEN